MMMISDINRALVAQTKRREGESLSRDDRKAIDRFRTLFRDDAMAGGDVALKTTLKNVLGAHGDTISTVSANPLLSQHLKTLREQGSATDAQVAQIKTLAAKLSEDEHDAIGSTMAELRLRGGVSNEALADIGGYLDAEQSNRSRFRFFQGFKRGLATVGAAAATAVALPLLFWIPPVGAAIAGLGGGAIQAVQLGTIAGGLFGGATLGNFVGRGFTRAGANYGVAD